MILFPPAKINLGLNVLHKRNDGFHEIQSCMYAIPVTDVIEILPSEEFVFTSSGLTIGGDPDSNLCVKAYNLINDKYDISPVHIHLLKSIPMGAGLGGGSADATFVLRGLNEMYNLNLSSEELRELAAELGSDCPFFVDEVPQMATGRGEVLEPIEVDLSGYYLKIVNPQIHVGTAEAYAGVTFSEEANLSSLLSKPIKEWQGSVKNDFELSIFKNHPEIANLKDELIGEGAIYAAMSGSGSTVFGIFDSEPSLESKYEYVRVVRL